MIRRLVTASLVAVGIAVAAGGTAQAHPLGNFTINTSATLTVTPGHISVAYVVDRAEIPTFQELGAIDTDGDGETNDDELQTWASAESTRLLDGLEVRLDDEVVTLRATDAQAALAPGQGGLSVLRFEGAYDVVAPERGGVSFADRNFASRIGWREIVAVGADGAAVQGSSLPAVSPSDTLRAYPDDLLSSPPRVLGASFGFAPGTSAPASSGVATGSERSATTGGGALAGFVARADVTPTALIVAVLAALGLGALHALGPGHGKTLMAAYVVGRDGGARQAVTVGIAVAAMHTSSVLALGVVVLAAERLAPDRVYPWLTALSGLTALALGAGLLVARLRAIRVRARGHQHASDHEHDHGDDHHDHVHPTPERVVSRRGLAAVAVAGGILPSPSALLALLASFALGRAALGLALVTAFSLGLAATLSLVAIVVARARHVVEARLHGRVTRLLPLASAAVIAAIGATITVGAVMELAR